MLMDEHAMQSRLPSAEERNGKSGSIMQPFEIIMDNVYMLDDNDNDDDSDSAAEWSNGLVMEQVFPCECRYSPGMFIIVNFKAEFYLVFTVEFYLV